jgi:capsular polysaccharide biosynthesis protein
MTLLELLALLRKKLALVIVFPLVFAILTAVFCWGILKDVYTATVTVYVLSSSNETSNSSSSTTYSDLSASQMLSNDIATLAKSGTVLDRTANNLNMSSLDAYKVSVTSGTTTRVISISVTGASASATAAIGNQIASELSKVAVEVMGVKSINVIDAAATPTSPSGPSRVLYTAVAALAGLFLAIAVIVIADMLNTSFKSPEEMEEILGIPVVGRLSDIRKLR